VSARREALKAKIAALRAKTTGAGCTEAEAISAAALAAELMSKHGLDEADLVMTEAWAAEKTMGQSWRADLVGTITLCTNTAGMLTERGWCFIGQEPGPDIAVYLRDVTFRAVEGECQAFKVSTFYRRRRGLRNKRAAAADFRTGLIATLRRRLLVTFGPSRDEAARARAVEARERLHGKGRELEAKRREVAYSDAYFDGQRAGRDIALNHGVGGQAQPRQLGKAS